jgi:hypothetical protein
MESSDYGSFSDSISDASVYYTASESIPAAWSGIYNSAMTDHWTVSNDPTWGNTSG